MDDISIFVGSKSDIPANLVDHLCELKRKFWAFAYKMPLADIEYYRKEMSQPQKDYIESRYVMLIIEDELIGYGAYERNIKYENTNRALIDELFVDSRYRKKGYGTRILRNLLGELPNEVEVVDFWALKGSEGKYFFDKLLGAPVVYLTKQSVSLIRNFDLPTIKKQNINLVKNAEKKGYSIRFYETGSFEDIDMVSYIQMDNEIRTDMPKEGSSAETATPDIDRFQENKELGKELGFTYYTYVALKNNEPIGMTETIVGRYLPSVGMQALTGVVHKHRGHKLGLTLKSLMLQKLLEETQVEYWTTDNAGSNQHMIKINEILGYKEWVLADCYEMKVEDALDKFGKA
jgi:GNAT superfamily N-acetyltransferase